MREPRKRPTASAVCDIISNLLEAEVPVTVRRAPKAPPMPSPPLPGGRCCPLTADSCIGSRGRKCSRHSTGGFKFTIPPVQIWNWWCPDHPFVATDASTQAMDAAQTRTEILGSPSRPSTMTLTFRSCSPVQDDMTITQAASQHVLVNRSDGTQTPTPASSLLSRQPKYETDARTTSPLIQDASMTAPAASQNTPVNRTDGIQTPTPASVRCLVSPNMKLMPGLHLRRYRMPQRQPQLLVKTHQSIGLTEYRHQHQNQVRCLVSPNMKLMPRLHLRQHRKSQ